MPWPLRPPTWPRLVCAIISKLVIGKDILRFDELTSTSDKARETASLRDDIEGIVVIAKTQTRGRGKPGAGWFSPEGGLYISFLLKPFKNPHQLSEITLLGARAVVSTVRRLCRLDADIKLPNDVILNDKKVCGVLVERFAGKGNSPVIAVGIGVNVNIADLPLELKNTATSLLLELGRPVDLEKFTKTLIEEINIEYLKFLSVEI